ncbi:MAG: FAD-dependent oxidoreductase [Oceanospirillaceae bacterium]|uniref:NAD(P)/FAD-dependent oxidoreductase n=1 Tax=unclassified Thalassolituus TaxID=2624967 RepID=UPI000C0B8F36|nr:MULTISPECIES: FAD-dependent oxidoreductase [unclassified Thalassolituus]MAK91554.1 FAD-dependent oxidoreductase [Thalassolituus sp.]MAS25273.1 FAD-dependent oxidoreductase [Oceanospirillaceae bacterium]MAX99067.1 FAD-dependent oxidoreductase [Oceanospirillaceae bacterium]MBL35393.1 FAD-dependent oxidoreductase [Oceanospirillaceae bacterium]MBS53338.1 FAD-dependent oxidoreductase [Oceanospirillaceae bacterium]|tara:strand:+ start:3055 stop:4326 length:1272 start_codon:yes stop_codon:yes gene_type:complete
MKEKIAVIGSGISGLTCAWLLKDKYDISLYEAGDYLGGHTQTTDVDIQGKSYPVNTGFIVFNDWTYPNFIKLMNKLGVAYEASDMSFSVKCENTGLEYNGHTLDSLFAQRSNLLKPKFWFMIRDILRFNKETRAELAANAVSQSETLGQYLARKNYGDYFRRFYIIPMGAAIWSASEDMMMDFPLYFFLRFFNNHGMLSVDDRPQWRVISNGSQSYVRRIREDLNPQNIHLSTPVEKVERHSDHVVVHSQRGDETYSQTYSQVIFACHSDQALSMLAEPTAAEQSVLSAIPYQENDVVLHTDASVLPQHKKAWAAWNYHIGQNRQDTVAVTYYMNRLQNFDDCPVDFCVTLNKSADIDESKVIRRFSYDHPVFTLAGIAAQQRHHEISNHNRSHFCGAYWFNGFHEDGVVSALRVTKALGVEL